MSRHETEKLQWWNLKDEKDGIVGVCIVKNGFEAELHKHREPETYHFLYGVGKLYIRDEVRIVHSPCTVEIGSNVPHAMTPISSFVVLLYSFKQGPFNDIKYEYLHAKL